jgi:hypothetical protein
MAMLVEVERIAQVAAAQVNLLSHQHLFQLFFADAARLGRICRWR